MTQPSASTPSERIDRGDMEQAASLIEVGQVFWQRGWSVGTSSNYSAVLGRDPLRVLITASGMDKGRLTGRDFVVVDDAGRAVDPVDPRPSAETLLHTVLAANPEVGAVLHTHSIWGTLLSDLAGDAGGVWIEGYEMLKGLEGVRTHEHREWVEIFPNTQDMADLSGRLARRLEQGDPPISHGFLLRNHGLYTWGRTIEEARRHVEIFEFLFEVVVRRQSLIAPG